LTSALELDNKKLQKLFKKQKRDYNKLTQDLPNQKSNLQKLKCYRKNKKEAETLLVQLKKLYLAQGKVDIERLTNNGKK